MGLPSTVSIHTAQALLTQHFYPSDESNPRTKQIKTSTALIVSNNLLHPESSISPPKNEKN